MDFSFSEEQVLLRNTVQGVLRDGYGFDKRCAALDSADGLVPGCWEQFAELGLLAAPFAGEHGGLDHGSTETMVIMEELGRALVVEPYLETVVLAGGLLRRGSADQQAAHLPGVVSGADKWAFAWAEPEGRYDLADLVTTARPNGAGYVLSGHKTVVVGGPWANRLAVTARTGGGRRERDGIGVFLVDKDAGGVDARDYPTVDGRRASEITFENVRLGADAVIGAPDAGLPLAEAVVDEAIGALCAEAIGAMAALNTATVEYCKTRTQFGQPIGKFQVLQHRMVDMFVAHEQSISMTYMVNLKLDDPPAERMRAASGAKVQIGKAGRFIGQQAIQLHGGMGMTDELNVGHYAKRLAVIDTLFGGVDHHLRRYARVRD